MVRSSLSEEVHLFKELNEGRGEPPFLGKGLPGARATDAKALSLVRTWQVGGTAEKSRSQQESEPVKWRVVLSLVRPSVLFLLQIFSHAHITL